MMTLASVSASGQGETDRLLAEVVSRLTQRGVRVAGALRTHGEAGRNEHCNSDLWLLPDGPAVRITQDLGAGSAACRMDAGALEGAVGLTTARFAQNGADLVVLNKFGLSEAEGRGFRALIADALGRGVPVLLGLSDRHRAAFDQFSGGMATALRPDIAAILAWCASNVPAASPAEEGA